MRLSLGLLLIGVLALSCLSTSIFRQQEQALVQQYIQTIKYRNLVINLGNGVTTNDLIHDAKKALNVLIQQPEVDPNRISIIGHSEGAIIAPTVAIDNSTKLKNIILMGTPAQNLRDLLHYQSVSLPSQYATQVL